MIRLNIEDCAWYNDEETAAFLGYKNAAVIQKKRSEGTFNLPFHRFCRKPHTKGSTIKRAIADGVVTPKQEVGVE